ncbi:putative Histone-lysine N-methyltransferase NSD2, partial [Daphnia magna]
ELVNGRQPVLPVERLFPWPAEEQESHVDFLSRVHKLREAARLRILKKQRAVKERVDKRRRVQFELLPGDLVLVRRRPSKKGLTKKFLPKFTGSFQVVKKVSATTFLVEDLPAVKKKIRSGVFMPTYAKFVVSMVQLTTSGMKTSKE